MTRESHKKADIPISAELIAEFDAMFERMQTPESRSAMLALFYATPEEMGQAALAAARKQAEKVKHQPPATGPDATREG